MDKACSLVASKETQESDKKSRPQYPLEGHASINLTYSTEAHLLNVPAAQSMVGITLRLLP